MRYASLLRSAKRVQQATPAFSSGLDIPPTTLQFVAADCVLISCSGELGSSFLGIHGFVSAFYRSNFNARLPVAPGTYGNTDMLYKYTAHACCCSRLPYSNSTTLLCRFVSESRPMASLLGSQLQQQARQCVPHVAANRFLLRPQPVVVRSRAFQVYATTKAPAQPVKINIQGRRLPVSLPALSPCYVYTSIVFE